MQQIIEGKKNDTVQGGDTSPFSHPDCRNKLKALIRELVHEIWEERGSSTLAAGTRDH